MAVLLYTRVMNINTIDLNLYKIFIAVYENKSLTKAAEKLVLSVPAVSMRIKELERQLNCKLFIAYARGVHPTKEADELYIKVSSALASISDAQEGVKEFTKESSGALRIGCRVNTALHYLVDPISAFIKKYPKVRVTVYHETRTEFSRLLSKHDLDVVVSRLPFDNSMGDFTIERLRDFPKGLYASSKLLKEHNLPTKMSMEQFKSLPLVTQLRKHDEIITLLHILGYDINSCVEIGGDNKLVYAMVKCNVGVGYVNECCVDQNDDIVQINVNGIELPKLDLGVIYHTGESSKLVQAFLDELRLAFKNQNPKSACHKSLDSI